MTKLIRNPSFHHIEIPCDDLELAERFYGSVLGAKVYMRRDAGRRPDVPSSGEIAEAERQGFAIEATFMSIGSSLRIGFLKRPHHHRRFEIDHLAFAIDDDDLPALGARMTAAGIEIVEQTAERMLIRDPFGLSLEIWPRSVLERMGFI